MEMRLVQIQETLVERFARLEHILAQVKARFDEANELRRQRQEEERRELEQWLTELPNRMAESKRMLQHHI